VPPPGEYAAAILVRTTRLPPDSVTITLNGEPYALDAPLTIGDLLARLDIDARRVAVEHNLVVLKRERFGSTVIGEGDQVEIVNFVGGGRV
jgi:sulfur carrier protein